MAKIKNIIFKIELEGEGVVNFDGKESRWIINKYCDSASHSIYGSKNNNITCAKSDYKVIGTDETDNPVYKRTLKISSNCLRHSIFENDYDVTNGSIMRNDNFMSYYVSSSAALLRGYMFATEKRTLKRKSPITITSALETSGSTIIPDLHSVSGDKSENSLFYIETTGKTKYEAKGNINLKELEFLSCDDFFDRRAVDNAWIEGDNGMLNNAFMTRYNEIPYTLGWYTATANAFTKHIGEYGLHFNDKFRKFLIIEFFKRLLHVNITRAGAFAKVSKVYVKPVYDAFVDTYDNPNDWVELVNKEITAELINSLYLYSFYAECDEDADAVTTDMQKTETNRREQRKADKDEKKRTKSNKQEATDESN